MSVTMLFACAAAGMLLVSIRATLQPALSSIGENLSRGTIWAVPICAVSGIQFWYCLAWRVFVPVLSVHDGSDALVSANANEAFLKSEFPNDVPQNPEAASLVTGLFWGLWHLPLFFMPREEIYYNQPF